MGDGDQEWVLTSTGFVLEDWKCSAISICDSCQMLQRYLKNPHNLKLYILILIRNSMSWIFSSLQVLSRVRLTLCDPMDCSTPGFLSITNSPNFLKLMSMESVMPSNHHILCHPLLLPSVFPSIRVFSNESFFPSGGQSIGASASA